MNFQRGIIGIIIILIIAAIVGLGGFWIWKYFGQLEKVSPQPSAEIGQPEDETADWKIYRNEEYGFEIKYPLTWQECEISKTNLLFYIIGTGVPNRDERCYPGVYDNPSDSIQIWIAPEIANEYSDYQSLKEAFLEAMSSSDNAFVINGIAQFQVYGIEETMVSNQPSLVIDEMDFIGIGHTVTYIFHKGNLLRILPFSPGVPGDPREKEIDRIFSTFSFIGEN